MVSNATASTNRYFCSKCRTLCANHGFYLRTSDRACIRRFRCRLCQRTYSDATHSLCYQQKKRQLNPVIFKLLSGGYSQRRAALDLGVNRKTVVRKFLLMGEEAKLCLPLLARRNQTKVTTFEFDDLETYEHTKCKPLSVTIAVEYRTRRILGFRVSEMPARGPLAAISRKKYGRRKDLRKIARLELFREMRSFIASGALIKSDQNPHYVPDVFRMFPDCLHKTYKGRKPAAIGQGELKKGRNDPLFSLNHTCAMLRANLNRLFRRTWCTTKLKERLTLHIALYSLNHNLRLI